MSKSFVLDPATFPSAFDHALNSGDLDQLLRLYDPQACIRTSGGVTEQGSQAIRQEMEKLISARAQLHNKLRHTLRSENTALIVVDWTLELDTPEGKHIHTQGTATNVIRHSEKEGWRMLIANPQGTA